MFLPQVRQKSSPLFFAVFFRTGLEFQGEILYTYVVIIHIGINNIQLSYTLF